MRCGQRPARYWGNTILGPVILRVTPWCGPCFGQGPDALKRGERAITSFNRNWQNRMGVGGEGYLASPAVVAASALVGYMAPPSELGLQWDPERFGV